MGKQGPPDSKIPIISEVIKQVKEKYAVSKVGVVGYCYGGKISTLVAGADSVCICSFLKIIIFSWQGTTANVIAHPATITPEQIGAIKKPTLWICAETDQTFPIPNQKEAEEILKKNNLKATFKFYAGTTHGFAVRGDEKDTIVKQAKLSALQETIHFFQQELA